jgi:eukaryotic-like serine/threonine-protein kinase
MSDVPARIGPYAIESRLGAGGMAETFVAIRNMHGVEQRVCLKRILPAYAKQETTRKLFQREANISAGLRHANLVSVLDMGEDSGAPYLVMELIEGADLGAILAQAPGKRLPPDLVAFVLAEMAHGLHEAHGGDGAHAGVVHRDLSPSNVLISTAGEVKVADFGIAKALSGEKATATVQRGKVTYMAPEQLKPGPLDPRADFFALGVMGYEMVSGVRPFEAEHDFQAMLLISTNQRRPVVEVAPDAPRDLLDTIEALMSPAREDRPADGHAIVERLAPVVPPSSRARKQMGALAQAALDLRLAAETKDPTSPDPADSMRGFAPTMSAPDAGGADVHSVPTARRAPAVEPIGTNPTLSDRLPPSLAPGTARAPIGLIAAAAAALLTVLAGGAYLFSTGPSTPPIETAETAVSPPIAAPTTVSAAPVPTTPLPAPTTPPPEVPRAAPPEVSDPPAVAATRAPTSRSPRRPTTPAPPTPAPTTEAATPPEAPGEEGATAQLELSVTPWGNVWVDHRYLGRAPTTVRVTPGSHQVQAGFDSPQMSRTVRVRSGQRQHVDFDLTESAGSE